MKNRMLKNILFLDIETATIVPCFEDLSERMQLLWKKKASQILRRSTVTVEECSEVFNDKAAIYAEYNKIICLSVGYLAQDEDGMTLKIKSYSGDNEKQILEEFSGLLNRHYDNIEKYFLCGHNIKEFDCPVLCRKMLIHEIELPKLLRLSRKKSWQVEHLIDTLEMWKFGDYKNYISLDLLATVLNIPSPKLNLDGSLVSSVYWDNKDLKAIRDYCEQDVVTTVSVFLKLIQEKVFDNINFVTA